MCHFISAVIDSQANLDDLNKIGQNHNIIFDTCTNNFVIEQLKKTERYLQRDSKNCDCGTELGLLRQSNSFATFRMEKSESEKLIKKGWSQSKINRWVEDRKTRPRSRRGIVL
jgi:hypothetical protein